MGKRKIAILCGGRSAEHEVSLQSANSVVNALDRERYEPLVIGIDKAGCWLYYADESRFLEHADCPSKIRLAGGGEPIVLLRTADGPRFRFLDREQSPLIADAAFPVMHGTYAEDGTMQGLLKLVGLPFVGSGVLGSAAGMDKDVMKRLLRDAGLPIGPFRAYWAHQRQAITLAAVEEALGLPVFVKPANLGSSVGVHRADTDDELQAAVDDAFLYDRKIVIEAFIPGREIECSVLGNSSPEASLPGEVMPAGSHGHYSYEAKYIDTDGARLQLPADLPEAITERVRELAVQTFQVLECEGLGRVDLFLRPDGELVINEINTLPGFTSISMYPKLWQVSGLAYPELIHRLIELALERGQAEGALQTSFPGAG